MGKYNTGAYQKRVYRHRIDCRRLQAFHVIVKETDLAVYAKKNLEDVTRELVLQYRGYIEAYIHEFPEFANTFDPWQRKGPAPNIVDTMVRAGKCAGVGPMAAVAGAMAEYVGRDLLSYTDEVIVENGGDIFLKTAAPVIVGLYAGRSPLSLAFGLRLPAGPLPTAVCTSSATVGHSVSMGKADAVCVVAGSCSLADASATAIGNIVHSKKDIKPAIEKGQQIKDIKGLAIIVDDAIGLWGEVEVVSLKRKKG